MVTTRTGTYGFLNDLWEYSASTGEWTWVGGSNTDQPIGDVWDVKERLLPATFPEREPAPSVGSMRPEISGSSADVSHNGSTGQISYLNDLWKFGAGEWTWMSGSNAADQSGSYGASGMAGASNNPGAQRYADVA